MAARQVGKKYVEDLVSTTATRGGAHVSQWGVRRRFRDFVTLAEVLGDRCDSAATGFPYR